MMGKGAFATIFCACILLLCQGSTVFIRKHYSDLHGDQSSNNTITDETIKKVFEKFKQFLNHDYIFQEQHFLYNTTEIFINATVNDAHLKDPMAYDVSQAHANMSTLEFSAELMFAELSATGVYQLEAENEYFHLIGNGKFSLQMTKPSFTINWKFNLTQSETLEMEYFDINYIFPEIKVNIENLGGDEEVSQTLNDLINLALPSLINVTKGDVEKVVNQYVQQYSAFILKGMTVDNFVDYVNQFINW